LTREAFEGELEGDAYRQIVEEDAATVDALLVVVPAVGATAAFRSGVRGTSLIPTMG
jgi:hypothetical protein